MKRPYKIGWFRDPFVDDCVFLVTKVFDGDWFITPYESVGDSKPNGCGHVLTMAKWKRLEQTNG